MKIRELKMEIDEGQTAMLYDENYGENHHVFMNGKGEYVWSEMDKNGLLLRTGCFSWLEILGRLPESASSKWDAR